MAGKKSKLKYEPEFSEKVSRLFIFRGLWMFAIVVPFFLWMIWISIVMFLQFWYMLILGQRHKSLWDSYVRFVRYIECWNAYFNCIVDERPEVLPQ